MISWLLENQNLNWLSKSQGYRARRFTKIMLILWVLVFALCVEGILMKGMTVQVLIPTTIVVVVTICLVALKFGMFYYSAIWTFLITGISVLSLTGVLQGGLYGIGGHVPIFFLPIAVLLLRPRHALILGVFQIFVGIPISWLGMIYENSYLGYSTEEVIELAQFSGIIRTTIFVAICMALSRWASKSLKVILPALALWLTWVLILLFLPQYIDWTHVFIYPIFALILPQLNKVYGTVFWVVNILIGTYLYQTIVPTWTPFCVISETAYLQSWMALSVSTILLYFVLRQLLRRKL